LAKGKKLCSCCGRDAGVWEQWSNQDKGFGICAMCFNWYKTLNYTKHQLQEMFGVPNVNYKEVTTDDLAAKIVNNLSFNKQKGAQ